jgi:hypothetical protein
MAAVSKALPLSAKLAIVVLIGLNIKVSFHGLKREQRKIRHAEKRSWEISVRVF